MMEEEERTPKRPRMTDCSPGKSEADHTRARPVIQSSASATAPSEHTHPRRSSPLDNGDSKDPPTPNNDQVYAQTSGSAYPITIKPSDPLTSKSQLKRLRRNQAWEAGREYRKERRKEKIQAKRQRKKAAKAMEGMTEGDSFASATNIPPNNQSPVNGPTAPDPPQDGTPPISTSRNETTDNSKPTVGRPGKKEHRRAVQLPVTLILDCGFNDLMLPKELISLGSQLTRAYSDNAKANYRAHLVVSSFGGKLKDRFDTVLARQHEGWKFVKFTEESFVEAARSSGSLMRSDRGGQLAGTFESLTPKDREAEGEIVYLTSDSPETLETLKPNSTYIIGGLVDKNRHKGICYKTAMDKGVKTAKFPIGEYMRMNSRFVLATNHVVEIILKWLECGDWGEAFERVVPKRKGGVRKGRELEGDGGNTVEADELDSGGGEVGNGQQEQEEQGPADVNEIFGEVEHEAKDIKGVQGDH